MILVDSSVWIDYFNGKESWQTDKLDVLLQVELVFLGDLIYTEILQGFRSDLDFEQAKKELEILSFQVIGGRDVALQSAINYRILRKKGVTVRKTIDVLIGTYCILNDCLLLHSDKDFETMRQHLLLKTVIEE